MNKSKGVMLKLLIIAILYSLGFNVSILHKKENFNADKFSYKEKIVVTKTINSNEDSYNKFMKIVRDSKVKMIKGQELKKINQEKLIIEKAKQIEISHRTIKYNPSNLNTVSNLTYSKLHKLLKDTTMNGLESYFIEAEKEYHVNALFLVGLVALESGWNTSERATNGSNNLSGYSVYHSASRGSTFDSKGDCIMQTAQLIKMNYLNKDGIYHSGMSIWNVNNKYSETDKWSRDINSIINTLINKSQN